MIKFYLNNFPHKCAKGFSLTRQFAAMLVPIRLPLILFMHILLTFVGYFFALGLRFDFIYTEMLSPDRLWLPVTLLILFRQISYLLWDLNSGYWKYFSTRDCLKILKAHALASLLFAATIGFSRIPGFPRSVILIEFALSLLFSGGVRLLVRLLCERLCVTSAYAAISRAREVLVLGAGDSAHLVINNLQSFARLPFKPVAVLDDSERLQGGAVYDVPIVGALKDLEETLLRFPRVSAVITAIPSLSPVRYQEIERTCSRFGVALKKVQSFEDIACIDADERQEELSIESVLEKDINIEHEESIYQALREKKVLVTGAGGSIGSELVRQILSFKPQNVILLDHSEYNLYQIGQELLHKNHSGRYRLILANICNQARLLRIMKKYRPDIVFHAAAYKHVPLMEENVYEAFNNNVIGTRNVLWSAHLSGAKRFVLISSDKAVDPTSVMGASKKIAEMIVQDYANLKSHTTTSQEALNTAIVRFGNVINSSGSVIPLFKQQILSGGPITITHPDMQRFFMSIREAVRLVLTAGILGENGEAYVLDMGKALRVEDVARKMLVLYGRRDIPIVYTGVRPGEKLNEELTAQTERIWPTSFNKVKRIESLSAVASDVFRWVERVAANLNRMSDKSIAQAIADFACAHSTDRFNTESSLEEHVDRYCEYTPLFEVEKEMENVFSLLSKTKKDIVKLKKL